ncbi:MAG TPA: hypothetical protein VF756_25080 [Thermoanaerobaculia bacterium]
MVVPALHDLVRAAVARDPWVLLLEFRPSDDELADWMLLSPSLLALDPSARSQLMRDLRRYGLGVVLCASEEEARRLLDGIRTWRLRAEVFVEGRQVSWPRPGRTRRRA